MKRIGLAGSWDTSPAGLVVLDVDGVVLPHRSSWQVLHDIMNIEDDHEVHYRQFDHGNITFEEWGKRDAELWRGDRIERIRDAGREVSVRNYYYAMVRQLRERGLVVGLLSAGVHQYLEDLVDRSTVDFVVANELEVDDGYITGEVDMQVTTESKADWVSELARDYSVPLDLTVAAGDSEHDLQKFETAAWSIAFAPSSAEVKEVADDWVREEDGLRELHDRIVEWYEGKSSDRSEGPLPDR